MKPFSLSPHDLLFFRDGRPMEAGLGSGGHGARWPDPSIFFHAVHAALHRAFPDQKEWEHAHHLGRSSHRPRDKQNQRFGSLSTVGPFPANEESWFFTIPADVAPGGDILRPVLPTPGAQTNLPKPLLRLLANPGAPSKESQPEWWSRAAIEAYLSNAPKANAPKYRSRDFFEEEWTTVIGRDDETGAQDGERIYSAQYLRLRRHCRMGVAATLPLKQRAHEEGIEELLRHQSIVVLGGQQRTCGVEQERRPLRELLPRSRPVKGSRVKWLLLSPALFPAINGHPGGWLPNWVDAEQGKVLLRQRSPRNPSATSRADWREAVKSAPALDVRLVAAAIPKPRLLTRWSQHRPDGSNPGPQPTQLAVPAGAVYYFEGPDAAKLADLLSWHGAATETPADTICNRRSTLYGEQGFGIGVCAPWEAHD